MAGFRQYSMEPSKSVAIVETGDATETTAYPMNARYVFAATRYLLGVAVSRCSAPRNPSVWL